ncbi:hypothetical protein KI387_027694 [Taxus chinensis]|uniref:Apple domain-containing protein n=1 Tax=Taxus chinensis TaxID=29808 RepID=A0AA38G0L8_TAXCH|nr:hypothetical protein KI387_027694 [Taxus chinensis]
MTIIWVANRETPIKNVPGVFNLPGDDGHLRLFDLEGCSIWSADNILKALAASILDDGNFLMAGTDNISEIVWESFRHPTDTWFPGLNQWNDLQLTSWMISPDLVPRSFSFEMDPSPGKKHILLLYDNSIPYWYSGEWTGDHFSNLPEMLDQKMIDMSFIIISHSTICLRGFVTKQDDAWDWDSQQWWPSSGYVGFSTINGNTTDTFLQVTDKSLAVEQVVSLTEQQCWFSCLNNCFCTAFALANSTPSLCQLRFADLINARDSSDCQSIFIKLDASELRQILPRHDRSRDLPLCFTSIHRFSHCCFRSLDRWVYLVETLVFRQPT